MKKFFKDKKLSLIIYIFLIIIRITYEDIEGLQYPNIFTLLSQKILMVASDGIHFFTSNLEDDNSKKITFESPISSVQDNNKVCIVQFPENDGGYILILAKSKIFFFKPDGVFIKSFDFTEEAAHYCIIPYKLEDNYLYYIITYPTQDFKFVINYNKFNLNSEENTQILLSTKDIIVQPYTYAPSQFNGVNCIFMSNSTISDEILACFYSVSYPPQLQGRFFITSNDNIIELTDELKYYEKDIFLTISMSLITVPKR